MELLHQEETVQKVRVVVAEALAVVDAQVDLSVDLMEVMVQVLTQEPDKALRHASLENLPDHCIQLVVML